uniref:Uncharacterized protein n=1 Tax=Panagrolaimus sp. ES5 TaxID=591445 RepID=A0AC34FC47_9BILA
MITKESEIFFTDKQQSFVNVNNYDNVNIYNSNSNLNLNANYKSLSVSSVQSYCKKTTSGKSSDSYDIGINEGHKRFQKYKKSDLSYVLNERQVQQMFENRRKDFSKKDFFEKDSLNVNSSTLSLHIAAYENSMETSYANECNEADGFKNKGGNTGLKWKNLKQIFTGSTLIVQVNPFEFSRQKNNQNNKPEVMQFKSSQRLLNPNLSESKLIVRRGKQ